MLDSVEANMEDAIAYVEKAEIQLHHARELHDKARSRMCCVLFYVTLAFVILALWLFGTFTA